MVDIKKWQDRIENLLQVQKDLCLEQINTTFTRNELIELRLLLNEMMEIKNNNRAGAVTPAESEDKMKYSSFEMFGVNVYEKGKLARRKTFKKLDEAIEFARDMGSAGYTCKYVTLDEIGRVIDEL